MPHIKVHLRVPDWPLGEKRIIEATAAGKVFKVRIPNHLRAGQYFQVRVPIGGNGEQKAEQVNPEVSFNLEPNIIVGSDKYFKEVKTCGEWCDISKLCCPYTKFTSGSGNITLMHKCCCLPCCCDFEVSHNAHGKAPRTIGTLAPASCTDQPCKLLCCPCCYTGPKMQAKFEDASGNIKFQLKSEIKCCQYLCLCLEFCTPCVRCYRFCSGNTYTQYTQNIYGADVNSDDVKARITYTDRMICPCIPDERVMMKIEPIGQRLSEDDLILLSVFPTLISGYTFSEFFLPLMLPGGLQMALPTPTGVSAIDDANNIEAESMSIEQALAKRKQREMH